MSGLDLLAHAAPISYGFPLPIWLYALAGGVAVLASAPAAALTIRHGGGEPRASRNIYPSLRRLRLGAVGLTIVSLLFVWALVGGFGATSAEGGEFFENPATILIWVDFWVGLGLVSVLIGNVWDFVSPLNAAARLLDRLLARREVGSRAYPEWLGQWPAFALLLVWSWGELVWAPAKDPQYLALIAVGYFFGTLGAAAVFGAEPWLGNAELFTVVARTLGRFAPLALEPAAPGDWLVAPPEERAVRLRTYGSGLRPGPLAPTGSAAFVVGLLATVVFDGFSQTARYLDFVDWINARSSFLRRHEDIRATLIMLGVIAAFLIVYLGVCAVLREDGGVRRTARRYAVTLIPIAGVYFIAHYFVYLLIVGQLTLGVVIDPFGKSWNPWGLGEYNLWKGIAPAGPVWWTEVVLIVWGHIAGIVAAHRIALESPRRPTSVLLAQAPLVLLMVAYTMGGLWVLAHLLNING